MKKILSVAALIFASSLIYAQPENLTRGMYFDREVFNVCASIFLVALFMIFILTFLKRMLEYRLKNKIVEKGVSDNVASSILKPVNDESENINLKWFSLLAGTGIGLIIVNYTQPLGIHSFAIMSLSIAAGFLAYHFFTRQAGK